LSRHLSHLDDSVAPPPDAPPGAAAAVPLAPLPPVTRLRTCVICLLPDASFTAIETALASAGPTPSVAEAHGVGLSDLSYHVTHRQSEALSRERYEREQAQPPAPEYDPRDPTRVVTPIQRPIDDLVAEAQRLHQQALRAANFPAALFTLREMGALLVKLAEAVTVGAAR
jgi:hypothetical protein